MSKGIDSDELAAMESPRPDIGVAALDEPGREIGALLLGIVLPLESTQALRRFGVVREPWTGGGGSSCGWRGCEGCDGGAGRRLSGTSAIGKRE